MISTGVESQVSGEWDKLVARNGTFSSAIDMVQATKQKARGCRAFKNLLTTHLYSWWIILKWDYLLEMRRILDAC